MRVPVFLSVFALVLGACGGGGAETDTTVADAEETALTTAVPTATTEVVVSTTMATTTTTAAATTTLPAGPPELPDTPVVAVFGTPYKWGAENGDATVEELGFDPAGIEAHWYRDAGAGRWIAVFAGLDLAATGPVCPTSSFFGDGAQGSSFFGTAAAPGADCDAAPAGIMNPDEGGVSVCEDVVSLLTLIPTGRAGQLFAGLEVYPEGGTSYAVGGYVVADQSAPAIDPATLECG